MRLFVGLGADELNFNPRSAFKKLKIALEQKEIEHRWVPVGNYHMTLVFLGEVEEARVPEIKEQLKGLVQGKESFVLKIDGMGAFPEEGKGRVIWLGVQNSVALRALQGECAEKLREIGFSLED